MDVILKSFGIDTVKTSFQARNANSHAECYVLDCKRECLKHLLIFRLNHLQHVVDCCTLYFNEHRPHQSLDNPIPVDSEKAFDDWYRNKSHRGGHPWEICRGGNSTHIALMANRQKNGWRLYLAGSSRVRVVETVKMAIAMSEQDIPFILTNAQEILCMIKGSDYCGIVPKEMIPKYCHHCFPDEDKIIDFINPWHDENMYEIIKRYATWYPLDKLQRM